MSRIESRFADNRATGRKALVPYIVAGDPEPGMTVELMHALVAAGADLIELGVPFSDPMAEGPVIQLAHERALVHGVTLRGVLAMVAQFRRDDSDTPVVLMGYANPIEAIGYDAFAAAAGDAGVDGVLIVDMPPEEATSLHDALRARTIDSIYLLAPTTTETRARAICAAAGGYLYYVSLKGVTGAANFDAADVARRLESLRALTALPICVGFGIKDAASARAVAPVADGVVVGSALVDAIARQAADGSDGIALIRTIRDALDT